MLRSSRRACICACIFSILLAPAACTSGSTYPEGEEETLKPFLSLRGLGDGAPLKGKVQLIINGKARSGFSELRILVGEEEITSIDNPTLPHEQLIETYHFANGEHQIRAEAEVAGEDTTVEKSLSATFENYLVEIDTDGYIKHYITTTDEVRLFVSDPTGALLGSAELTGRMGELIRLLPPEEVDDANMPAYINVTLANTYRGEGFEDVTLTTYAGLFPWNLLLGGESMTPADGESSEKEFFLEVQNYLQGMDWLGFYTGGVSSGSFSYGEDVLRGRLRLRGDINNLITVLERGPSLGGNTVIYNWDKDIQHLADGDTLRYDAEQDFDPMAVYSLSHSLGLELKRYSYSISVDPNSWDNRGVYGFGFSGAKYDKSSSDTELGLWVIDENRLHDLTIQMQSQSDANSVYTQNTRGNLPTEFRMIDGNVELVSLSRRDLQIEVEGQADYVQVLSSHIDEGGYQSWKVLLPDTMGTFFYPEINDLIDYESLNLTHIDLVDYEQASRYADFIDTRWGEKKSEFGTYRSLRKSFSSQKQPKLSRQRFRGGKPLLLFQDEY